MHFSIHIKNDKRIINRMISLALIMSVLAVSFLSPVYRSIGMVSFYLSFILLFVNLNTKTLSRTFPILLFTTIILIMLCFSGRYNERGFNAPITHATHFSAVLLCVSIAEFMKRSDDWINRIIIKLSIIFLSISIFVSIFYVIRVDKYAIRYNEGWGYTNVLRFAQTYSIVLLCVILFFTYLFAKNNYKCKKTLLWIAMAFTLFTISIFLSMFATALLLLILGLGSALVLYIYTNNKFWFSLLLLAGIVLLVMIFAFSDQIAALIYSLTENMNWILRERIRGVVDKVFSTSLSTAYKMERREELMSYSINTFKLHPLLGVGYKDFGYGVIGMHHEWADMLGSIGLLGTSIFAIIFAVYAKSIFTRCENQLDRTSFLITLLLFFILGFVNPCLSIPVVFVVFCVAPNISCLLTPDSTVNSESLYKRASGRESGKSGMYST